MRSHLLLVLALVLAGCETEHTETVKVRNPPAAVVVPTPAPAPTPVPVAPREATIDDLVLEVQNAADGPSQATALNRLHTWMAARELTYTTRVQRADTDEVIVQGASIATVPTRVSVFIADRGQPFRDFGFNCRDNRNLVILGVR